MLVKGMLLLFGARATQWEANFAWPYISVLVKKENVGVCVCMYGCDVKGRFLSSTWIGRYQNGHPLSFSVVCCLKHVVSGWVADFPGSPWEDNGWLVPHRGLRFVVKATIILPSNKPIAMFYCSSCSKQLPTAPLAVICPPAASTRNDDGYIAHQVNPQQFLSSPSLLSASTISMTTPAFHETPRVAKQVTEEDVFIKPSVNTVQCHYLEEPQVNPIFSNRFLATNHI